MATRFLIVADAPTEEEALQDQVLAPDDTQLPTRANGLLKMTGLRAPEFLELFERRFVLSYTPTTDTPYSPQEARTRALLLTKSLAAGSLAQIEAVLAIGRRAAAAFNWWDDSMRRVSAADLEAFEWRAISTGGPQGRRSRIPAALIPARTEADSERRRSRSFFDALR